MYKVELRSGLVIPAFAGIQLDYPFIQVTPTPITFLDHLDSPCSAPSLDRLLPCEGLTSPTLWIPAFAGMTGAWEGVGTGLL